MSAFICGPDHFRELAAFATSTGQLHGPRVSPTWLHSIAGADCDMLTTGQAFTDPLGYVELVANILFLENVRSVRYRYPDGELPGPVELPDYIAMGWYQERVSSPVHILKMCKCLAYQSCEHPEWESSTAFKLLEAIKDAAIAELPGYEDAPWDFWAEEAA